MSGTFTQPILLRWIEFDSRLRLHLYGCAIAQERFVLPLPDSGDCRRGEHRMPGDELNFLHIAVLADCGQKYHFALNARLAGQLWIFRIDVLDQHGLPNRFGDLRELRAGRSGCEWDLLEPLVTPLITPSTHFGST